MTNMLSEHKINFIIISDFPLESTGIISTFTNIVSNLVPELYEIYCDQPINVAGRTIKNTSALLQSSGKVVVFSHMECKKLRLYIKKFPEAIIHVGDWPGAYWLSKLKHTKSLWQILGFFRFYCRISFLPRRSCFLFVNESDTKSAVNYGFKNSRTLEIGVVVPTVTSPEDFNRDHLCFTGNFRYAPNKEAAIRLIEWVKTNNQFALSLVGYHADDFRGVVSNNVTLYDSVPSVVNFLAEERPIYVSPLGFGAGAKNKIMEALVCACPVIATPQSLDPSLKYECISVINGLNELLSSLVHINDNYGSINQMSIKTSQVVMNERSWKSISEKFQSFL